MALQTDDRLPVIDLTSKARRRARTVDDVLAIVEAQRRDKLHAGAQLYVSQHGEVICDKAVGEAAVGTRLTPEHVMRWYAGGKPLLAVAMVQLFETGQIGLDDRIGRFIPEWAGGKERATIRHLLTHVGGFAGCDRFDFDVEREAMLRTIAEYPADHEPGTRAAYDRSASWHVLARIIEVVDGRSIERYVRDQIWDPLSMDSTYLGISHSDQRRLGSWISPVHWRGLSANASRFNGTIRSIPYRAEQVHNTPWHLAKVEPGDGFGGPAHDLGHFYEALLRRDRCLLRQQASFELLMTAHRVGVRDVRLEGARVPWGLGVQVAGCFTGSTGARVMGHNGMCVRAFCDPAEELVVVYLTNGLTAREANERRMVDITEAVYELCAPRPTSAWVTVPIGETGSV